MTPAVVESRRRCRASYRARGIRLRRLGAARDFANGPEGLHERILQSRLISLDARKDAAQSLAREKDQIVTGALREIAAPLQYRRGIQGVANGDHRDSARL